VHSRSVETGRTLILRDEESGASIFLLPGTVDGSSTEPLQVKLTRTAEASYLSEVVTELGADTFNLPRTLTRSAKVKDQGGIAAPGSN
jgi:hypothetical protein